MHQQKPLELINGSAMRIRRTSDLIPPCTVVYCNNNVHRLPVLQATFWLMLM